MYYDFMNIKKYNSQNLKDDFVNLTFLLVYCGIALISPGPTNLMILSTVHNHGVKKAFEFSYGAISGFGMLLILSLILNSFISVYLPIILITVQIIGSIYMLYLAYKIYHINVSSLKTIQAFASFKTGFILQFVNPKGILFAMTVFPTFIMPYHSAFLTLIQFVIVITLISAVSFLSWALFGAIVKNFLEKYQRIVNTLMSLFLVVIAVLMSGVIDLISV